MSRTIEARRGAVRAVWQGATLASSDHTLYVEGNHYFPPEALDRSRFEPSAERSYCPWKGQAGYYDVVVDGKRNAGAAWFYPDPLAEAEPVRGHVAFWRGVEVVEA